MTRYSGVIGYAEEGHVKDGIWEDERIVEKHYYGSVSRLSRNLQNGSDVLPDISISNSISIVADAYAYENFVNMRYIEWQGTKWIVSGVEVQRPRLTLTLGGVYNGPTSTTE